MIRGRKGLDAVWSGLQKVLVVCGGLLASTMSIYLIICSITV